MTSADLATGSTGVDAPDRHRLAPPSDRGRPFDDGEPRCSRGQDAGVAAATVVAIADPDAAGSGGLPAVVRMPRRIGVPVVAPRRRAT